MHPEIRQMGPGDCPICGMSLEPLIPELDEEENPELKDFSKRFWWSLPPDRSSNPVGNGGTCDTAVSRR